MNEQPKISELNLHRKGHCLKEKAHTIQSKRRLLSVRESKFELSEKYQADASYAPSAAAHGRIGWKSDPQDNKKITSMSLYRKPN